MNEKSKIHFKWLEKLKNVKHIEIIIICIFLVVLILIYTSTSKTSVNKSTTTNTSTEMTLTQYVSNLESNLEETISNIRGVKKVDVLITLNMSSTTIENNVIKSSVFPDIKGIVVVASGVEDLNVKLNVLKAIEALVDVSTGCIEILSSN